MSTGACAAVEECGCDFVQLKTVEDLLVELHHVIPDDGTEHDEDPSCSCGPDLHQGAPGVVIVDHIDRDDR